MVAQVGPLWTVAEYLLPERYSTIKHEYHGGHLYALAVARRPTARSRATS